VSFRSSIKGFLRKILNRVGFDLIPSAFVYDWQTGKLDREPREVFLPETAIRDLVPENPRLLGLQERYQKTNYPCCEALIWTEDRVKEEDILYFRGHNAYVFQEGRFNRNLFGYLLAYYYTKSIDRLGLLDQLEEDGAFGAVTYEFDGKLVSRDLLDSILEFYFLEDQLGMTKMEKISVLDIGAGYGRMAHRMVQALPNLTAYHCTDAVAVSSFIAEYYLNFRGIQEKANMVALDRIRSELKPGSVDLALNIHCFSECPLVAIEWWLELLVELEVQYLFIVPNSGKKLLTADGSNFLPLVEKIGYQLVAQELKYQDPFVQKYALTPDYYHLFKYTF
jgi:hypothetical protein